MDTDGTQACQIQMPQSLRHRRNLQGQNRRQRVQHLRRKASLQQMSDTRGSLPNTTMGLLLMVKPQDLDRITEGNYNVVPRGNQADTIKKMDLAGLMVRSPGTGQIAVMSNGMIRGVAYSQGQHQKGLS